MGHASSPQCGRGHRAGPSIRLSTRPPAYRLPLTAYLFSMSSKSLARLQLLCAAFLFSTGGAAIKAANFTGWQIASFRSGIAAIALLLMTPAARKGWTRQAALV